MSSQPIMHHGSSTGGVDGWAGCWPGAAHPAVQDADRQGGLSLRQARHWKQQCRLHAGRQTN